MKLVVFDIDGTLTLGDGLGTRCFFAAFEDVFGAGVVDRRFETYAESTDGGIAREAVLRALGRPPSDAEIEKFKAAYLALLEQEIVRRERAYRPVPGAERVLPLVAARAGWRVAIATGNWRRAATLKLECACITAPAIAACSEDGNSRSEILAACVRSAASLLGDAQYERVVYVGDQLWDLRAAREVRAAFVGIATDERRQRLENEGARVVSGYEDAELFLSLLDEVST